MAARLSEVGESSVGFDVAAGLAGVGGVADFFERAVLRGGKVTLHRLGDCNRSTTPPRSAGAAAGGALQHGETRRVRDAAGRDHSADCSGFGQGPVLDAGAGPPVSPAALGAAGAAPGSGARVAWPGWAAACRCFACHINPSIMNPIASPIR